MIEYCKSEKINYNIQNPELWRGEVSDKFDAVFLQTGKFQEIADTYMGIGTPVFIFDWGYMKRVNLPSEASSGYWQVSYGKLNSPPKFKCESDRFDKLDIEIKQSGGNKDGYALIIGQMPNDKALFGSNHEKWLKEQIAYYTNKGFDILYREHPRGGLQFNNVKVSHNSLAEAIDDAKLVVCYTSNTGHEALLSGVPVVSDSRSAYYELTGETIPSIDKRREYFSRLAYGQWLVSEMPEMIDFVFNKWIKNLTISEEAPLLEDVTSDVDNIGKIIIPIKPVVVESEYEMVLAKAKALKIKGAHFIKDIDKLKEKITEAETFAESK